MKPVTTKVTHEVFWNLYFNAKHVIFIQTGWHLDQVDVECSGVKYNFPCDRWLAEDEDDKQIVRELVCTNIPQNGKLVCTNISQNGKFVCTNIPQIGNMYNSYTQMCLKMITFILIKIKFFLHKWLNFKLCFITNTFCIMLYFFLTFFFQ